MTVFALKLFYFLLVCVKSYVEYGCKHYTDDCDTLSPNIVSNDDYADTIGILVQS